MTVTEAQGAYNTGFSGSQQPVIQNLGPGDVYFNTTGTNILTTGIFLPAGAVYEFPTALVEGGNALWVQVDTGGNSADLRIINVG
jgi:hypothetical protein